MTLKLIRLELARGPQHPMGDPGHGYEFRAPLTVEGRLDELAFKRVALLCTVRHFRPDAPDERGQLIHNKNGWAFSYAMGEDDDEPIFRLSAHALKKGEYVTVTEHDGISNTFRVQSITDLP